MGPRVMRRLPKYVHGFVDRHGRGRFYFRRRGFEAKPLPGLPWSPEFMAAYEYAARRPTGCRSAPHGRALARWRALALSYFASPDVSHAAGHLRSAPIAASIERFCTG